VTETAPSLMTPELRALIGYATEPVEMYDVVDKESIRRFVIGIPDQDPRHWDEELASPRFGGVTTPPMMLTYIANRKPPHDEGGFMKRTDQSLPPIRQHAAVTRHLHGGDEFELFRYAQLGDHIFYQKRYVDIQEKFGRSKEPFLVVTWETRYWNQNNETILVHREIDIYRP
jgi:N-terminal half of MaoC dehydratase